MKIAICDDQLKELQVLESLTAEYIQKKEIEAKVLTFSHPDELMRYCENDSCQIYVLDIVMPMMDGISLGKEIRMFDQEAQIIFATTEPQFALDAYVANPINFLVKPIDKARFFETLDLCVSRIQPLSNKTISVKTTEGLRVLRSVEIVACEYKNHAVLYTLSNGEVVKSRTISGKFGDPIKPLLEDRHFLQPHTSFIVNMRYIELFRKDSFTLRGDITIPIAASKYANVRDTYMDYLMGREGV